ncbi:MAG: hypothetical protein AB4352_13895 [Hormoscilla sp.]
MLVPTVLLPSVLTATTDDSDSFGKLLELLINIEKSRIGVILVDEHQRLWNYLLQRVNEWPQAKRTKLQTLLKKVRKNKSFVSVTLDNKIESNCSNKHCDSGICIAKQHLTKAVVARQDCHPCAITQLAGSSALEIVNLDEEKSTEYFYNILGKSDRVFPNGVNLEQFKQEIILPIFRYSKNVKIYDRYVGRSILRRNAKNYKSMLEWLLEVFADNSRQGIFEVYCGFKPKNLSQSDEEKSKAKTKLKQLEAYFQNIYPQFKLIVKDETKGKEFIHDRYIITDQLAISMGRGIGLLSEELSSPEDWLLDFNIACCSEPGEIEAAVRSLPDL